LSLDNNWWSGICGSGNRNSKWPLRSSIMRYYMKFKIEEKRIKLIINALDFQKS